MHRITFIYTMIAYSSPAFDFPEPLLVGTLANASRDDRELATPPTDWARLDRELRRRDIPQCEEAWQAICGELMQRLQLPPRSPEWGTTWASWMGNAVKRYSLASPQQFWTVFSNLSQVADSCITTAASCDRSALTTAVAFTAPAHNTAVQGVGSVEEWSTSLNLLRVAQGRQSLWTKQVYVSLSARDLKAVWSAVIDRLEMMEQPGCAATFLVALVECLTDELITKIEALRARASAGRSGSLTRDLALSFAILIDLPPPFPVMVRPTLSKQRRGRYLTAGMNNETPGKYARRGGVSINVRLGTAQERRVRGPSDDSSANGCSQLARRRRDRSHRRVVELSGPVRPQSGRKMVSHVRVARLNGGRGDQARTQVSRR